MSVLLLFLITKPPELRGDFARIYDKKPSNYRSVALPDNSWYITGTTNDHVYLANKSLCNILIEIDIKTSKLKYININLDSLQCAKFRSLRISTDSPFVYLYENVMSTILTFNLNTNYWAKSLKVFKPFIDGFHTDSTNFVLRSIERDGIIIRNTVSLGEQIKLNRDKNRLEDILYNDGVLNYSKDCGRLVYTFYYQKKFMVLDRQLKILGQYNTIDSLSNYSYRNSVFGNEMNDMTTKAQPIANKSSFVDKRYLYVISNTAGNNEGDFYNSVVLDKYDLLSGGYQSSIKIENHNQMQNIKSIKISNSNLLFVSKDSLFISELNVRDTPGPL